MEELAFPRYVTKQINVSNGEWNAKAQKEIKALKEEGQYVRTVLTGEEKDVQSFDQAQLKELGVKIQKKQEAINEEELEERVEAFTDTSLLTEFESFSKKNKLLLPFFHFNKIRFISAQPESNYFSIQPFYALAHFMNSQASTLPQQILKKWSKPP